MPHRTFVDVEWRENVKRREPSLLQEIVPCERGEGIFSRCMTCPLLSSRAPNPVLRWLIFLICREIILLGAPNSCSLRAESSFLDGRYPHPIEEKPNLTAAAIISAGNSCQPPLLRPCLAVGKRGLTRLGLCAYFLPHHRSMMDPTPLPRTFGGAGLPLLNPSLAFRADW
jgi:hypothetical protein